jgi:DNA-binding SARP family transcriptional activator
MPVFVLRLCGDVLLTSDDGTPVEPPLGSKTLALLAFLALERGPHRREEVTALLWGEYPEDKAKASLRQALTHLRDALGDALVVDRASIELRDVLVCDVDEFLQLAASNPVQATTIEIPRLLANLVLRNCPAYEEWADEKRLELVARYTMLVGSCTREAMARREWRDAARLAARWTTLDPLAEEPVAALIETQHFAGDRVTARATHARYVARLAAETGGAPGRAIGELMSRLAQPTVEPRHPRAKETWYEHAPSFIGSLVGRQGEWDMLRRGWSAVAAGASRIALIEGEPGVGKTRLADDFLHWVASQGGVVLRGRGYDAHAGAPFGAVIEALHSAVDAPGVAGVDPEWLGEIGRVLPEIRRRFSGLPEAAAANVATDGWRLFEAIAQVLLAISEDSPIAILIDDLQWCDADSCSLLHFLVRRLADARVLWCATFTLGEIERDAPAARLARALRAARDSTCVVLSSLSEDDVWRLIRELARVDAPDGARRLAGRIHEATAGNPFYVIELLKTLFARELLTVDAITEAWIVQPAAMTDTVPEAFSPTVHDAIAERIECLPDHLHALLVSIAVAGRGCRTDALSHLHGISRLHAAALGDALVERHLAVEEDGVYRCAHPIIANVVRGRVSASRRREVHRALALTLELLLPKGRSPEGSDAGEIARHAEQAGDRPLAYRYALVASDACSQRCAYDEALAWLDLASGAADTPDESDLVDRTTARILELAGWREVPPVRAPVSSPLRGVEPSDLDLPTRALG